MPEMSRPSVRATHSDRLTASERLISISASADHAVDALRRYQYLVLSLLTSLYLIATCFRAYRKLFWYDELFTLYISRLPDAASVWNALRNGADLNPPMSYLLAQLSAALFGEGHVGTRLPEILGFWVCCLCLFRFVSTRTSVLAGLISMLFPLVTTAYFYAYEARPHGIVLGCGGLAIVCWQSAIRSKRRRWWLSGLFASLLCGMLSHTYAVLLLVPIVLAEFLRSVLLKRIDWMVWLATVSPLFSVLLYLPLFRTLKSGPTQVAHAKWSLLVNSYQFHLSPAAGVLSAALILTFLFTFVWPLQQPSPAAVNPRQSLGLPESCALVGFVAMPVFCFLVSELMGVPLYSRYSISAMIGVSCLFGIVIAQKYLLGWSVLLFIFLQIAINFYQYVKSDFIIEPSTSLALSTKASEFAEIFKMMQVARNTRVPIVLLGDDIDFLPIMHYAPAEIGSRLVYVIRDGNDVNGEGCVELARLGNFPGRCENMADFLSEHDTFLARSNSDPFDRLGYFIRLGAEVRMLGIFENSYLVSVTMKKH
jgi:hypothetical protein